MALDTFTMAQPILMGTQPETRRSKPSGDRPSTPGIAQDSDGSRQAPAVPPTPADELYILPTTIAQRGFWYLDRVQPGNPAYNVAVRFRLVGPLKREAFERAVAAMVARHEILRTRIAEVDGTPFQVVAEKMLVDVKLTDLTALSDVEKARRADAIAIEEACKPFDLSVAPLMRVDLLRLSSEEHVLLVTIHHIISDGWSIGIIAQELGALYEADCLGKPSTLAPLPLQYGDFAVWQQRWLQTRNFEKQRAFWMTRLVGLKPLELPADKPRSEILNPAGAIESILLSRILTDRLESIAAGHGATFFMVCCTALKVMLGRETGQEDVAVGTLFAGRSRVEVEPLIGPFINPVVLRTQVNPSQTFLQLLARVSERVIDAFEHGDLPFERLVEGLQPRRDRDRHPIFQVNLIFQRDFVKPCESAGLSLTAIPSKSPGAIYDLNFFFVERQEGWRLSCEYRTGLYSAGRIVDWLLDVEAIFQGVAGEPETLVSELPRRLRKEPDALATAPANVVNSLVSEPVQETEPDDIEAKLTAIWEQLIGAGSIGLDEDFFEAGGHSLMAMRLLGQVERAFGQRITLATLLHEPTIRELSARLREGRTRTRRDQAIAVQTRGSKVPLVLVDTGPYYRPLIRHLGQDQPVIGLTLPDLADLPRLFTVKDIAANLIAALREVQPVGPYCLSGWCHAGVIAFEMAQQLVEQGESVPLLAIFDADTPAYVRRFKSFRAMPVRFYFLAQKVLYRLGQFRTLDRKAALALAKERVQSIVELVREKAWRVMYRNSSHYNYEHLRTSSVFQFLAVADYEAKAYEHPAVLFRSEVLQGGRFRDPTMGWGEVIPGGLTVIEMEGDHSAMFVEPIVATLAEHLVQRIPIAFEPIAV